MIAGQDYRIRLFDALVTGAREYGIFMLDREGNILSWNEGAARLKGYSADEILGRHFSCFYTSEDLQAGQPAHGLNEAKIHGRFESEGWRVRRDGSVFWANVLITPLLDSEGRLCGFSKLTRDATERRIAEERLRRSVCELRLVADAMPQVVWMADAGGNLTWRNGRWSEYGVSAPGDPAAVNDWSALLHPADVSSWMDSWHASLAAGLKWEARGRFRIANTGEYRWHLTRALPLPDDSGVITRWLGTSTDIDDYEKLSRQLEQRVEDRTRDLSESLIEKTTLLKEVHHRVKNNLQVVCSLLSMQLELSGADLLTSPLADAHRRVLAMSLIHEQIYQAESLADLNFGAYIEALAESLFHAYCIDVSRIGLQRSVEPVHLTIHAAIPCGLILNELVSNALKHAFPNGRSGVIRISFGLTADGLAELSVADNGIGLPAGKRWDDGQSLGLQVVKTLVRQIKGELSVSAGAGLSFTLRWHPAKVDRPMERREDVPGGGAPAVS